MRAKKGSRRRPTAIAATTRSRRTLLRPAGRWVATDCTVGGSRVSGWTLEEGVVNASR